MRIRRALRYLTPRLLAYLAVLHVSVIWSQMDGIPAPWQALCVATSGTSVFMLLGTLYRLTGPSPTDIALGRARQHPFNAQDTRN